MTGSFEPLFTVCVAFPLSSKILRKCFDPRVVFLTLIERAVANEPWLSWLDPKPFHGGGSLSPARGTDEFKVMDSLWCELTGGGSSSHADGVQGYGQPLNPCELTTPIPLNFF